jgi:hypothetical protein
MLRSIISSVLSSTKAWKKVCKFNRFVVVGSSSSSSHQRAAHEDKPGVVGKAAWKPPPPPERFLVHIGSASAVTAGDNDAPANRRARTQHQTALRASAAVAPTVHCLRPSSTPRTPS